MVPPAPLPAAMSLRPSDMPEDVPKRRSRLQSVTARIYMEQWCDLKGIDPENMEPAAEGRFLKAWNEIKDTL